ncbi:MAG: pantoate--beta-alanine ligase [Rhodospirillales bacterium]|nr:pantoate--beta-alanine ligase [Rhodospirillales bacterium]
MLIARTLAELDTHRRALAARRGRIALVPTMGALHAGHRALVDAAVASGAGVITSIFVNPTQFGPNEDLSRYPRDEAGDLALLREAGCALVWLPDVATMYPPANACVITPAGPAQGFEGAARPGHFQGVATVCTKLFGQCRADLAFFGEKDWQQLQVIRRVVTDLHLPTEIVGIATVREADGLAMSSRNRFLSAKERARAPALYAALTGLRADLRQGAPAGAALDAAIAGLRAAGFAPDYLALVAGESLTPITAVQPGARLIATARLGSVRLLDNIGFD